MFVPPPEVCIDNAIMIGYSAHEMMSQGFQPIKDFESVQVDGFEDIGHDVTKIVKTKKRVTNNFDRLIGLKLIAPELNCDKLDSSFSCDFSGLKV